jgi:uncharacterized phage infection (PIP) family protein YhgE
VENDKLDLVIHHLVKLNQEITELKNGQIELTNGQNELRNTQNEFAKSQTEFSNTQNEFANSLNELRNGQNEIRNRLVNMEHDQGEKIKALFDAREVQFDVNDRMNETLNRIESKLDRLSLSLPLKRVK